MSFIFPIIVILLITIIIAVVINVDGYLLQCSSEIDPELIAMKDELVDVVLSCVKTEYPYNAAHTYLEFEDVGETPRELHPSFYGSYDHHSSVHNHYVLVHLLRLFGVDGLRRGNEVIQFLNDSLTRTNIDLEMEYFIERPSYERPYGWAWLLYLTRELYLASSNTTPSSSIFLKQQIPEAKEWYNAMLPFATLLSQRFVDFLPNQTYPLRTGTHSSTAFALTLSLDFAVSLEDQNIPSVNALRQSIIDTSLFYYLSDANLPARYEPGGEEFVSPVLNEAALMQSVLSLAPQTVTFQEWLDIALPNLENERSVMQPVVVADRSDYKIVHLDGLNLSRCWNMKRLICSGDVSDEILLSTLRQSALEHLNTSLPYAITGDYGGDHWLPTFAVLALNYKLKLSR